MTMTARPVRMMRTFGMRMRKAIAMARVAARARRNHILPSAARWVRMSTPTMAVCVSRRLILSTGDRTKARAAG
jgi:hypothetical protein